MPADYNEQKFRVFDKFASAIRRTTVMRSDLVAISAAGLQGRCYKVKHV